VWRAFFFAVGIMLIIVGIECLLIESATIASEQAPPIKVEKGWFQPPEMIPGPKSRVIVPKEWIPWSSLASGALILLYSFTLPKRWGGASGG
jgi:hypothetical protein